MVGAVAMLVSIIIPVLNEAPNIANAINRARALEPAEVIVVDGGSTDATRSLAALLADQVVEAARGRGRQMNAGAAAAGGSVLLFLHADTVLPEAAPRAIIEALKPLEPHPPRVWGRFDVAISGLPAMLRVVAWSMNLRSRLTGIATGDQAIFMTRAAFEAAGGFLDQPLMEDIELCRRLKRVSPPACLRAKVITSGRRWEERGVWRTIFLMWRLRLAYFFGASPEYLATRYR